MRTPVRASVDAAVRAVRKAVRGPTGVIRADNLRSSPPIFVPACADRRVDGCFHSGFAPDATTPPADWVGAGGVEVLAPPRRAEAAGVMPLREV
jgi:hypothetical protein